MQPTGPYTLTAGDQFSYNPPAQLLNPVAAVAFNRSPFDIVFSAPISKTVPAWTADLLAGPGAAQMAPGQAAISHVAGVPQLAGGASSSSLAALYIDWLAQTELPAPGTYPMTLGVPDLTISGGTVDVNLAAGSTVDIGNTPTVTFAAGSTVDIGNTPAVSISGSVTVGSITAGSVTVNNAAGTNGVNVAPKASRFFRINGTAGVLVGSSTSPAYTVYGIGASNNAAAAADITFTDTFTGSVLEFILPTGGNIYIPIDFGMQAGSELEFSSSQQVICYAVYG